MITHSLKCIIDATLFYRCQNSDRGFLDDPRVLSVIRRGRDAVIFVEGEDPLEVGRRVRQTVDWARRFDHMQQHTGQHLVR